MLTPSRIQILETLAAARATVRELPTEGREEAETLRRAVQSLQLCEAELRRLFEVAESGTVEDPVCRKCGQPVVWATTRLGRRPLDKVPIQVARPKRDVDWQRATPLQRVVDFVPAYRLHWLTCPRADDHVGRAGRVLGNEKDED